MQHVATQGLLNTFLVEEVPRDGARLGAEVVVGVVRLADAAEEHGDDARQVEDLADEEGRVGHDDEEGRLQLGVIPERLFSGLVIFHGSRSINHMNRANRTRSKQRGSRLPNGQTIPLGCLCIDQRYQESWS